MVLRLPEIGKERCSLCLVEGNSVAHNALSLREVLLVQPGRTSEGIKVRDKIVLEGIVCGNRSGREGSCLKAKRVGLPVLSRGIEFCGAGIDDVRP